VLLRRFEDDLDDAGGLPWRSRSNGSGDCCFERKGTRGSAAERDVDGNRRRSPGAHGFDDLGVVNALQVDRRDAEVATAELALDHHERYALVGKFGGVRVARWCGAKRRRTPAVAAVSRSCARTAAIDQRRPPVGPAMTQNSGPTGS